MTVADELTTKAHYFYALARATSNLGTKDRLVRLGDDYLKQAHELKHAEAFTPPPEARTNFGQASGDPPDTL